MLTSRLEQISCHWKEPSIWKCTGHCSCLLSTFLDWDSRSGGQLFNFLIVEWVYYIFSRLSIRNPHTGLEFTDTTFFRGAFPLQDTEFNAIATSGRLLLTAPKKTHKKQTNHQNTRTAKYANTTVYAVRLEEEEHIFVFSEKGSDIAHRFLFILTSFKTISLLELFQLHLAVTPALM